MDLGNLSPEQIEKAKACKSAEELIALAKEEGFELSEEQLESLTGGIFVRGFDACPNDAAPMSDAPAFFV